MLLWTNISYGLTVPVRNGVGTVLTNLTPGTYFVRRYKRVGSQGAESEELTVVVEAGQIAHADMVRTNGQSIHGKVLGPDGVMASGGYIFVKSGDATGLPWPQQSRNGQKEYQYRTFDVSQFGADGVFETAMLSPGTYTVVADVYPPGDGNTGSSMRNSGPDYVAVAKITVTDEAMPPVSLKLVQAPYVDIAGTIIDAETGSPVENADIESGTVNSNYPGEITWNQGYQGTAFGGRFALREEKAGMALRFRAPGYVPQIFTREEIIASRQTANLQVRFQRGEELDGVVLDHAGQPVSQAKVYLCPLDLGFVRFGVTGSSSDSSRTVTYWAHTHATTTWDGHFYMWGVDGNSTRVIVVTDDGQIVQPPARAGAAVATFYSDTAVGRLIQPVLVSLPAENLKITLPEPASLTVRYDIPGDQPEVYFNLSLHTNELAMPLWKYITLKPGAKVPNGGEMLMTNLLPGTYDFSVTKYGGTTNRSYAFIYGDPKQFVQFYTRQIVLKAGQIQRIDMLRSTGQRVQGRVTGLASITNTAGAFLYVASTNAIRNPNDFKTNSLEPCYDAVFLDTNELFQTALLEPGKIKIPSAGLCRVRREEPQIICGSSRNAAALHGIIRDCRGRQRVGLVVDIRAIGAFIGSVLASAFSLSSRLAWR